MDPDTTNKAITKLEKILRLIGYPDNPRNYTSYGPQFGNHYVKNILVATQDEFNRDMASAGGPSNRLKWEMPAWIVNAYYDPSKNEIVFPAGIIQSPFFDPTFPSAMNYGGIGMVGGHELTHSLDSQGRDFDGNGRLVDWWAPRTSQAFQERVDCIIDQYSKFSPLPGFYVNGNLTQGENIADAGGLKTAHSAYVNMHSSEVNQPSIVPGLNNEQLFFVGFAQTWCSKLTPAAIRQRLLTDPHSPPRFRVNGPAINLPAFAEAFQCPVGSPMNPTKRCQIW
jgi:predicted metalloendopeptidase